MDEGATDVLLEPGPLGEGEAALEVRATRRLAGEELRRADVVEAVDDHVGVVGPLGEVEGPLAPGRRVVETFVVERQLGEIAVRQRELVPVLGVAFE
jgi:hypothetical protein